jgi:hypothetical protein
MDTGRAVSAILSRLAAAMCCAGILAGSAGGTWAAEARRTIVPLQSSRAPTLAQPRFEEQDFTAWLPNRVLLEQLQKDTARIGFPAYIEGRAENFAIEFRAVVRPRPKGFQTYEMRWNLTDEQFEEMHQRLLQRGFILYSRSEFTGIKGDSRLNGVWIRVRT